MAMATPMVPSDVMQVAPVVPQPGGRWGTDWEWSFSGWFTYEHRAVPVRKLLTRDLEKKWMEVGEIRSENMKIWGFTKEFRAKAGSETRSWGW